MAGHPQGDLLLSYTFLFDDTHAHLYSLHFFTLMDFSSYVTQTTILKYSQIFQIT